jgi:hypothetical protein
MGLHSVFEYFVFTGLFSNLSKYYIDILKTLVYKYNTHFHISLPNFQTCQMSIGYTKSGSS